MMVVDSGEPPISSGKTISRRDFLKLATRSLFGTTATVVASPLLRSLENGADDLVRTEVLKGAREYLIENEAIPTGIVDVPNKNEGFKFADDILQSALASYETRVNEEGLPAPYFRESPANFDIKSWDFIAKSSSFTLFQEYPDLMKALFNKNNDSDILSKYRRLLIQGGLDMGNFTQDYALSKQKFGHYPITYAQNNMRGFGDSLLANPGSPIIARISEKLGISKGKTYNTWTDKIFTDDSSLQLLRDEIKPIWTFVENYVQKEKRPMPLDIFLAELIYREKGDISGALWSAAIITRLKFRHDGSSFENNLLNGSISDPVKKQKLIEDSKYFATLLEDSFASRVSANWVKDCDSDSLFAYDADPKTTNFKPFDLYSSLGDIPHGLVIMANCTVTSPEVVQAMTLYEDYYKQVNIPGPSYDYGLEKVVADTVVAYRAPQIKEILNKYRII